MALNVLTKITTGADESSRVTYTLEGNLDNATAKTLETKLLTTLAAKPAYLIFDLAKLEYVTSAGIRLFFMAQKQQKAHRGQVSFVHLQPQIEEVFAIMGSLPDVQIFRSVSELDAYLLARQKTYKQ